MYYRNDLENLNEESNAIESSLDENRHKHECGCKKKKRPMMPCPYMHQCAMMMCHHPMHPMHPMMWGPQMMQGSHLMAMHKMNPCMNRGEDGMYEDDMYRPAFSGHGGGFGHGGFSHGGFGHGGFGHPYYHPYSDPFPWWWLLFFI